MRRAMELLEQSKNMINEQGKENNLLPKKGAIKARPLTNAVPDDLGPRNVSTPIGANANPLGDGPLAMKPPSGLDIRKTQTALVSFDLSNTTTGLDQSEASTTNSSKRIQRKAAGTKTAQPKEFKNHAQSMLNDIDMKKQNIILTEKQQTQKQMDILNDELNEMLQVSSNTRGAMQEVNDAFSGNTAPEFNIDYDKNNKLRIKKQKKRRGHSDARAINTAMPQALEPIFETVEQNDQFAVVPVTYEAQKKARNALLKHRAKMAGGDPYANNRIGKDDTFVTGGGLPGARRNRDEDLSDEEDNTPVFDSMEDELLNKVGGYERDFKEMMNYLNEVESNVSGNDLKYIREMIGYSSQQIGIHSQGYEKVKNQVLQMGDEAVNTIKFDSGSGKMVESAQAETGKMKRQLAIIEEEDQLIKRKGDEKKEQMGMQLGGGNMSNIPLSQQKADIVNQLLKMTGNMKDFSGDMETRLEKAQHSIGLFDNKKKKKNNQYMDSMMQSDAASSNFETSSYMGDMGNNNKLDRNYTKMTRMSTQNHLSGLGTSASTSKGGVSTSESSSQLPPLDSDRRGSGLLAARNMKISNDMLKGKLAGISQGI